MSLVASFVSEGLVSIGLVDVGLVDNGSGGGPISDFVFDSTIIKFDTTINTFDEV